jgi:hypothetical protein
MNHGVFFSADFDENYVHYIDDKTSCAHIVSFLFVITRKIDEGHTLLYKNLPVHIIFLFISLCYEKKKKVDGFFFVMHRIYFYLLSSERQLK